MVHRLLAALAVLVASTTPALAQPPGPLEQTRGDLDGDGKTDEVRVGRDGQVSILFAGAKRGQNPTFRFALISGVAKATATIHGATILVTGLDRDRAGEAMWLTVGKQRRVTAAWRGQTGLVDVDTGTTLEVKVIGGKLYRYHDNPSVKRCDGEPAMLETEVFGPRRKMVPGSPPSGIPPDAPTITALIAPPSSVPNRDLRPISFRTVHTSSDRAIMSPDLLIGTVTALVDNDPRTAWTEGRSSAGAGGLLTISNTAPEPVRMLRLIPGDGRSPDDFRASAKPKRIGLSFDGGARYWVTLPDSPTLVPMWIVLPAAQLSRCVTVVLDQVHGRSKTTSISEIAVLTELDLGPRGPEAVLVERVVAGGLPARAAMKQLMSRRTRASLDAILAELQSGKGNRDAHLKLRRVLASFRKGAEEIARGVAQREATDEDRAELIGALRRMKASGAVQLAALARDRRVSRIARGESIAALMTMSGPEALTAGFALAGELAATGGQRLLRKVLANGLGNRRDVAIDQLVAAARGAPATAAPDLWRAVGVHAAHRPSTIAAAATALAEALATSSDYELTYRLLHALGRLAHPRAIESVVAAIDARKSETGATDIALRRVGTLALARNRDVGTTTAHMIAATRDADVEVRLYGVEALAGHDRDGGSDARLGEVLDDDKWPRVRRAAAAALAPRCVRPAARTHLRDAAKSELDIRVGTVVLGAVVACGGSDLLSFLVRLAKTTSRPTALRAESITQLAIAAVAQNDRSATPTLIELFEGFVSDSFSNEKALPLAQASARALCQINDPRAVKPLARAAVDSAFGEIQAAAARSLGCYCARETAPILRDLAKSTNVAVSVAARAALKQCKKKKR